MTVLILGGRNNGKYEFAQSLGHNGFEIIYKLNDLIKENTAFNILEYIKNKDVIIVCDEVGSGIVPIDKKDREYRENVGRCLCEIAKIADKVYRVYSGIGTQLK